MNGHHLILGQIADIITGERLADTHDERFRQHIGRLLIQQKGYLKSEVAPRVALRVQAGEKCAVLRVDYLVSVQGKKGMIVKYGPGSLVTRRRPALAASRLISPYQIPMVVVTNGQTAEILDGQTGAVIAAGFDAIPTRGVLSDRVARAGFGSIPPRRREMESRILYAYEVDDSCICDESICRL